jgi:ribose transport system permease protein
MNDTKTKKFSAFIKKNVSLAAFIILFIAFSFTTGGRFFTSNNLLTIMGASMDLLVTALGATFIGLLGSIDLSAGSMIALTGVVAVKAYVATNNLILAILAAMAISLLCYFVIVIAHTQLEVPTFICSLGMLSIARAVVTMISSGTITMLPYDSPFKKIFGLRPSILIVGFALFVFALIIEKYTLFGRYTRLIGGDEIVARLSGIDVNKRKIMVYLFAGIMTAIGGVIMAARIGSGSPSIGDGYELNVISAVVLGGTSQRGGIGGVRGTLIGALTLTMLANGLVLWGMPSEVKLLIKGAVLVLAVFISQERGTGAVVK